MLLTLLDNCGVSNMKEVMVTDFKVTKRFLKFCKLMTYCDKYPGLCAYEAGYKGTDGTNYCRQHGYIAKRLVNMDSYHILTSRFKQMLADGDISEEDLING